MVVIDITSKICSTSKDNKYENNDIEDISKLVSKCLVNHNTSVSAVLLYWDKHVVFDNGKNKSVYTVLARNNKLLKHANPINSLPDDFLVTKFGFTIELFITKQANNRIPAEQGLRDVMLPV